MKKILTLLLIIVSALSAVSYSTSYFIEESSAELSSFIVQSELEYQIHRVVDEMNSIIPIVDNQRVEEVINVIKNDPKVKETIDRYAQIFIKDIAEDENNLSQIINSDVHSLLYSFVDDFSQLMGDFLNPQFKEDIIKSVIDKIDLSDYLNVLVAEVDSSLTYKDMKILNATNFFYQHLDVIRLTSLLIAISSFLFALLLNLSILGALFVLIYESLFILLMQLSLHLVSREVFNRYLSMFDLNLDYTLFNRIEIALSLIFILSFVLRTIVKRNKQATR